MNPLWDLAIKKNKQGFYQIYKNPKFTHFSGPVLMQIPGTQLNTEPIFPEFMAVGYH